ncbi:CaiB/BaiF CoA transferase family protein [Streptomyces gilvus]|uniref:CaiB/BaiF CoA transferase family protein n=1 Tax=Streptomyces gilvus TaxID=2920937 RepID=UPI001F0E5CCF|nr:CoA transferase [Streptomyces sp. CME 23]MCH5675619.1 CoA transferase [Streptomyces sp. CME 23]
MTRPVLQGLTVLEFGAGSHAASLAGVLLADNGARVIKVEPPEGDRMRTAAPSAFLVFNRGKESVVADLRTPEGRRQAQELAASADVVITAFAPGVTEEFGVAYEQLVGANPALIHCSINAFGSTGEYAHIKAYEHVVQAKAGVFKLGTGGYFGYRPDPIFVNGNVAGTGAGHLAASGIAAALITREQTGRGQRLEVPLFHGLTGTDYFGTMTWQVVNGKVALAKKGDEGGTARQSVAASRFAYQPCTKDGRFVYFTALLPHQAKAILRALEIDDLLEDPRFAKAPTFATVEDAQAYEDAIWEAFRTRTWAEWDVKLRADVDIAYELIRTCEEGLDHPQVRHNGEVITVEVPGIGPVEQVGPVARFDKTPSEISRPAPAIGENQGPLSPPAARPGAGDGPTPEHPLSGITVVEFGYFYALPFSTALLGSLGARVIKIEDRNGDPLRFAFGAPETGAAKTMEGKESISVDLRTPEGREIVRDLVARADLFVNGFRGGIAKKAGLDYDTLKTVNPGLVYLHATGYGVDGEFAPRPMFAQCAQAVAGGIARQAAFWLDPALTTDMNVLELQHVIAPRLFGIVDGDSNASYANLTAMTLALFHKRRTGEGQFLTTSMLGGNLWAYADDAVRYEGKPQLAQTDPDLNGLQALYRLYQASEGWVFLAAPRQSEWEQLTAALDRPGLATDARFATPEDRAENDEVLAAELEQIFGTRPAAEWESTMVPRGIACVVASEKTISELSNTDPVLKETGLVAEVDHPTFGRVLRHGVPVLFSETPGRLAPGCVTGQHTRTVLEELDYSPERIAELEEKAAVYVSPLA